jgi:hypothetical protein
MSFCCMKKPPISFLTPRSVCIFYLSEAMREYQYPRRYCDRHDGACWWWVLLVVCNEILLHEKTSNIIPNAEISGHLLSQWSNAWISIPATLLCSLLWFVVVLVVVVCCCRSLLSFVVVIGCCRSLLSFVVVVSMLLSSSPLLSSLN